MSLGEVIGFCELGINQCLVVEVNTRSREERNQDHGQQGCGREPGAKCPDGIEDTNKLLNKGKKRQSDRSPPPRALASICHNSNFSVPAA